MRLFVAVNFTPEMKDALEKAARNLREQSVSGNFTRRENLHMTLAFIGETNEVVRAKAALDKCKGPGFEIALRGTGRFGDLYWVGTENSAELSALASKVRSALKSEGFVLERSAFKPHITIARRVTVKGKADFEAPHARMRVRRISLMKSERINGKLTYTEIYGVDMER